MKRNAKISVQYLIYRLILEFIAVVIIDIGAILWLFDFVKTSRQFSYAMLALVVLALIFIVLACFFGIKAVEIFEGHPKAQRGFKLASLVSAIGFNIIFVQLIIMMNCGLPNRSSFAYKVYRWSNLISSVKQDVPLEALSEAIKYDRKGKTQYYIDRGDIYLEIYDTIMEESVSEINHNVSDLYQLTSDDCLKNALADYSMALLSEPDNLAYKFKRGQVYSMIGNDQYENAARDLKAIYEAELDNAEYALEYGKLLIERYDISLQDEGLKLIEKAAEIDTDSKEGTNYYKYILKALRGVESKEIRSDIGKRFLRHNTLYSELDNSTHIQNGAKNSLHFNDFMNKHLDFANEVIEGLKDYVDSGDASGEDLYDYCVVLSSAKKYNDALKYIDEVIKIKPTYLPVYAEKAFIYNYMHDYDAAIENMDMLVGIYDSVENHIYRANILYNAKRYEDAINDYLYVVSKGMNKSAYSYYSIGQSYYRLENYVKANTYFEKAIHDGLVKDEKANCYREWGDVCYILGGNERKKKSEKNAVEWYNKAIEHYESAVNEAITDSYKAFCYYWAGYAYVNVYDYVSAADCFRKANELVPDETAYAETIKKYEAYLNRRDI